MKGLAGGVGDAGRGAGFLPALHSLQFGVGFSALGVGLRCRSSGSYRSRSMGSMSLAPQHLEMITPTSAVASARANPKLRSNLAKLCPTLPCSTAFTHCPCGTLSTHPALVGNWNFEMDTSRVECWRWWLVVLHRLEWCQVCNKSTVRVRKPFVINRLLPPC